MDKTTMLSSVKWYLSRFGEIGKREEKILEAMSEIDRAGFMSEDLRHLAYEDSAMPIGRGQTISQPSTVARMLQLLELKKGEKVLEIGAGSGWNAGLIGYIVENTGFVLTLEIVKELFENAKDKLRQYKNIQVKQEDFHKLNQKFDKIIFTAGISYEQEKIIEDFAAENLNENGVLICPYRSGPLMILKKKNRKIEKKFTQEQYVFVPLVLH